MLKISGLLAVCLTHDRVQIDLQYSESPRGYSRYIHFLQTPTVSNTGACDRQAVVKIDFSGPFKGAELTLYYGKLPRSWTLDISDSPTGDGFGGDDGTTSNMAEVQILNRQMRIYGNMLPGYMDATSDGGLLIKVIDGFATKGSKAVISITDERLKWSRGKIDDYLDSKFLFTLSGQKPLFGEIEHDVYIGFNRVVAGNYRNGSGLCAVDVRLIKSPAFLTSRTYIMNNNYIPRNVRQLILWPSLYVFFTTNHGGNFREQMRSTMVYQQG
ncbi:positive regulation of smoothened signaling pathway [Mactra antiquata]